MGAECIAIRWDAAILFPYSYLLGMRNTVFSVLTEVEVEVQSGAVLRLRWFSCPS